MDELPAVMVTGPRAAGKTTTAARHAASVVHLDRPAEASVVRADPDVALTGHEEPILLDEWQEVPAVLGAVKRAVDRDARPGRFLLTGSVRADLEAATWPGTGRVELALRSGFPEPALQMTPRARTRWLEGYVDQLLTRDAMGIDPRRDPARLRKYFEAYALNSAGIVSDAALLRAAGVDRRTATAYERLLTRDRLGDRFLHGIVFHTGPAPFELSERITAVPICALWG